MFKASVILGSDEKFEVFNPIIILDPIFVMTWDRNNEHQTIRA